MPKTDSDEDVLFASPTVVVTDRRILFGTRSYAASAISSVKVGCGTKDSPSKSGWGSPGSFIGIVVATLGVVFAMFGIAFARDLPLVTLVFVAISVVIVVLGAMIWTAAHRAEWPRQNTAENYSVQIHTLDGQKERIAGLSEGKAKELANAISLASTSK